jgi:SAM-dependent methyltransferase
MMKRPWFSRNSNVQLRRFRDADRAHYDWQTRSGYFSQTEEALVLSTGLRGAGRLLELGCGQGANLMHLAAQPGSVGVDLSHERLRHAKQEMACLAFIRADATQLPFRSDAFDSVLIRDVLHHVPDRFALLREAVRVLQPGGTLAVIEPNGRNPMVFVQALVVAAERAALRSDARRIESELRELGLTDVAIERAQPFPLARVLLHPSFVLANAATALIPAISMVDALAQHLIPRPLWMYVVARARKPAGGRS